MRAVPGLVKDAVGRAVLEKLHICTIGPVLRSESSI